MCLIHHGGFDFGINSPDNVQMYVWVFLSETDYIVCGGANEK